VVLRDTLPQGEVLTGNATHDHARRNFLNVAHQTNSDGCNTWTTFTTVLTYLEKPLLQSPFFLRDVLLDAPME
jgi:hypothetical protein